MVIWIKLTRKNQEENVVNTIKTEGRKILFSVVIVTFDIVNDEYHCFVYRFSNII